MLMIHIKKYYEGITSEEIPTNRYNSLAISPVHIHKDKKREPHACGDLFFQCCIDTGCS